MTASGCLHNGRQDISYYAETVIKIADSNIKFVFIFYFIFNGKTWAWVYVQYAIAFTYTVHMAWNIEILWKLKKFKRLETQKWL